MLGGDLAPNPKSFKAQRDLFEFEANVKCRMAGNELHPCQFALGQMQKSHSQFNWSALASGADGA